MRAVIQRVSSARVTVDSEIVGEIGKGILLLAGCEREDTTKDFEWIANKVANLRLFESEDSDAAGHFEHSLLEIKGEILAVSQFTLLGDARKGRRPSFSKAMPVAEAGPAFEDFIEILKSTGLKVETGVFQAMMDVELVNQGPVTLVIDSRN